MREKEMRNKENEEREIGRYIKYTGIKKIILFYDSAIIPSQICDGIMTQL